MKLVQSESTNSNWNVVYTYPNFEKKIHRYLCQKDIKSFLPLYKVKRQWSDRTKLLEVPLFPNYIFVKTNSANHFSVLNVPGVTRYVSLDGYPVVVSEKEIDTIKKMLLTSCLTVEQTLEAGDIVVIEKGPFQGMQGVMIERKGKTRLAIKIEALNRTLSIEICASTVRKIQ